MVAAPVVRRKLAATATAGVLRTCAAEAEQSAPVIISGEVIIWIPTGAGQYTPEVRAKGSPRVSKRRSRIDR